MPACCGGGPVILGFCGTAIYRGTADGVQSSSQQEVADMTPRTKIVLGGVAIGLLTYLILPWWISALIVIGAIAIPVAGYLMLDPSQRKRLNNQARKRIG